MSFAYVLALTAHKKDRISLLDWGSGMGHYFVFSRALLPQVEIDYCCKDVSSLCRAGRAALPQVTFHEDDACLERTYDLVLVSGSLQYSRDWRRDISRLAAAADGYLFVTRLPIVHGAPSFVVLHRPYHLGYKVDLTNWIVNRQEFLNHMESIRMKLVREFLIQERPSVYRAPEQCEYRGFLFTGSDSR